MMQQCMFLNSIFVKISLFVLYFVKFSQNVFDFRENCIIFIIFRENLIKMCSIFVKISLYVLYFVKLNQNVFEFC